MVWIVIDHDDDPDTSDPNVTVDSSNATDDSDDLRRLLGDDSDGNTTQNTSDETSSTTSTMTTTTTSMTVTTTSTTRTRTTSSTTVTSTTVTNVTYGIGNMTRCGNGFYMTYLGTALMGQPHFQVEPDLPLASWSHFLVFASSDFGEASTPTTHLIYDMSASVSDVAYDGLDLDLDQLGGNVSWSPPNLTESVLSYVVYLAESSDGLDRAWIPPEVPVGSNYLLIPPDTDQENYSHILVYTKSVAALSRRTNWHDDCMGTAIVARVFRLKRADGTDYAGIFVICCDDTAERAANASFVDQDLDLGQIGGQLVWDPPDLSRITDFLIYIALDETGTNRSLVGSTPAGVHEISVPVDTDIPSSSYLLVYARSQLQEQTTPAATRIFDRSASVSEVAFIDHDLDTNEIGGNISWTAPNGTEYVEAYKAYLSEDAAGASKSQIGDDVPSDVSDVLLSTETALNDFNHAIVFTRSALAEQTTPVSTQISDTSFFVVEESFVDLDLDLTELGGALTWTQALDDTQVTQYNVYLGIDCIENVSTTSDAELFAVISGIVSISLDGATSQQVATAMRAALARTFGVPASVLYVTVSQGGSGRRLATLWDVSYIIVVPGDEAASLVATASAVAADTAAFRTAVVVELVAAGVDSAVVATSLVVVNFARVTVQLVGVDQLPSVLPSFSTVFNVTNETEDDVVDIDNDSSAVRTTSTTIESEDDSEDSDADNVTSTATSTRTTTRIATTTATTTSKTRTSTSTAFHTSTTAALTTTADTGEDTDVNETDVGEDSDVPARRLSSVGSNATEVKLGTMAMS
ncbi:unnamed protein product [Symbiodinium sp. CCMP2592]|nr:unnamed protein product [Symbiodinium sp. CCMP2592]